MKNRKSLRGFTLIEMLIVMAIMIILMAIGVMGGRALINRANRIAHTNAIQQLYKASFSFYGDNGTFPSAMKPAALVACQSTNRISGIGDYLDNAFDGGSDATYWTAVSADRTKIVFCVTNGGKGGAGTVVDSIMCEGNGIGDSNVTIGGAPVAKKLYTTPFTATPASTMYALCGGGATTYCSDWQKGTPWTATCN